MDRLRKFLRRSVRFLVSVSVVTVMFGGVSSYGGTLTDNDIDLITTVTEAEAEGESEYGKRLVIDSILNRMDHDHFPETANEVIYQSGQFVSVNNGRIKRVKINDQTRNLVLQETIFRTNDQVIFFSSEGYSRYGYPLLQEGNHYFSTYGEG